jgi:Rps23 Pro-64 3,4-dihydroxylase Tpa1-like proline 4-hydroxylase
MKNNIIKLENFLPNNIFEEIKNKAIKAKLILSALCENKYDDNYDMMTTYNIFNEVYESKKEFKYIFFRTEFIDDLTQDVLSYFLKEHMINYINKLTNYKYNVTEITTGFISCYTENCFLTKHYDGCKGKIALIFYLNDVEKENGGSLIINNDIIVSPTHNTLVIMETNILHEVTRLKKGERWTIIFWMK